MRWDVGQYERYSGERGRPFLDLVARVGAERPRRVADLGSGPGSLTRLLLERWPDAVVEGVDASPEMVEAASRLAEPGRLSFRRGDVRDWAAQQREPVDVILSNATLQWVPDHPDVLPGLVAALAPGGELAFQVPGNFDQPTHTLLAGLRTSPRWRDRVGEGAVRGASVLEPADYLARLAALGCQVDAWETTYLHVLSGEDAVLEWMRGTGLRPVLSVLDGDDRAEFEQAYGVMLRDAYPQQPFGTVLPYRRIFVVARRGQR